MNENRYSFADQIHQADQRIELLHERAHAERGSSDLMSVTMEELRVTMEELRVADEELQQQSAELFETRFQVEQERLRYQDLFEFAPDGYLVTDLQGLIREANQAAERLLGGRNLSLKGKALAMRVAPKDRSLFRSQLNRLPEAGRLQEWEVRLLASDSVSFDAAITTEVVRDTLGKPQGLRWLIRDITRRKQAEEAWRREQRADTTVMRKELASEVAARQRLEEEIRTLREEAAHLHNGMVEANHRVKNSLQLLAALMEMSVTPAGETIAVDAWAHLRVQTLTLASVHELLMKTAQEEGNVRSVSAQALLNRLLPLIQTLAHGRPFVCELADAALSPRQASSLALIANELVSNAMKHGQGAIVVTFQAENSQAELCVTDDGPGFSTGFDMHMASHTGLELVETLTQHDLRGSVRFENQEAGGGCVTVAFPLPE